MLTKTQKDRLLKCWKDAEKIQQSHELKPGAIYETIIRHPYWPAFMSAWQSGDYDPDDKTFIWLGPIARCEDYLNNRSKSRRLTGTMGEE